MSDDPGTLRSTSAAPTQWIEDHEEELVDLATDLIGIDSQNPPGDTREIAAAVETYIEELGLEARRVTEVESKPNLLFSVAGDSDITLLYNGHLDTVPYDSDAWSYDPLGQRDGDLLYGRGATDMKGALAAMLHALRAYVETDTTPPVTVNFALVSDEETAGHAGLPSLLDENLLAADGCLIAETTCEGGMHSVTVADKGSIWMTLEATGTAAHGSRPPLGQNAIDDLFEAITEIRSYLNGMEFSLPPAVQEIVEESIDFYAPRMGEETARRLFTHPTMNVGSFSGGSTVNQVPESATAELDIRLTAGVDTSETLDGIEAVLADHPTVEITDVSWSQGTYESIDSPLADATSQIAEAVSGEPIYRRSATGGGDVKNLRNKGLSTIEFAFGTETAHGVDEHIPILGLQYNAEVFTRLPYAFAARLAEPSEERATTE